MSASREVQSLAPSELKRRLDAGEALVLLDVREPAELAICRIEGSLAIPMGQISARIAELDRNAAIVCICHHGMRSASVAAALARLGFANLFNLTGGIDRWANDVDPTMRRY